MTIIMMVIFKREQTVRPGSMSKTHNNTDVNVYAAALIAAPPSSEALRDIRSVIRY